MATVLVIENAPTWHLGKLETWLAATPLTPVIVRAHEGELIPGDLDDHAALIALGGGRGVTWSRALSSLLARAVADRKATLAFCSSARELATAFGGSTRPVTQFAPGPRLLARRDAAMNDPLFAIAPMALDVVVWRHEELADLPPEAELLAATPQGAPEIFRLGERAWGIQPHVELDGDMVSGLGGSAELARRIDDVSEHLADTWRPLVSRFASLAEGKTAGTPLPLLTEK